MSFQILNDYFNKKPTPKNFQMWQETALKIINLGKVEKKDQGIIFKYCKDHQKLCDKVLSEINQGEIKPPIIKYIKFLMKKT